MFKVGDSVVITEADNSCYSFSRELPGKTATIRLVQTNGFVRLDINGIRRDYSDIGWGFRKGTITLKKMNITYHKLGAFYE